MSESPSVSSPQICSNCHAELEDHFRFCPECGQETDNRNDLKALFVHFLSDYFTFDSKIVRSLKPLLIRPGFLTIEFLAGRKVRYIPPLRMFLFLSVIFFLLLAWSEPTYSTVEASSEGGLDDPFWDEFFESWLPKLFFFLLPLFALLVAVLYRKQRPGLLPHFLLALHFHATIFLSGIIYGFISWPLDNLGWNTVNEWLFLAFVIYLAIYLWKTLRKVYGEKRVTTLWKYLVLTASYLILIVCSTFLLLALSVNY